jgi:hypothetical protein
LAHLARKDIDRADAPARQCLTNVFRHIFIAKGRQADRLALLDGLNSASTSGFVRRTNR